MTQKQRILVTGGSGFIGTNVIEYLTKRNYIVVNADIRKPRNSEQQLQHWKYIDILDKQQLKLLFDEFQPNYLIHLAARTDLEETSDISKYAANIDGVQNLVDVINDYGQLTRAIFASSMLVCDVGYIPKNDSDYNPSNLYGKSKVLTEKIIRNNSLKTDWVIVRPTSIWGPWFDVPYKKFFDMILVGHYINPGKRVASKTYGYVGNTVAQIIEFLNADCYKVCGETFYLGDSPPKDIALWATEIAEFAGVKKPRTIPYPIIKFAAICGDLLLKIGVKFPITNFRLKNMTTDNIIPLEKTYKVTGPSLIEQKSGIELTLRWLKSGLSKPQK